MLNSILHSSSRRSCTALYREAALLGLFPGKAQQVAQLRFLRLQIAGIVLVLGHLDRHTLDHVKAIPFQAANLARIVRKQTDLANAEILQDLRPDAVIPQVGAKPSFRFASTVSSPSSCSL